MAGRGQASENAFDYQQALADYEEVLESESSPHTAEALYCSHRLLTGLGRYDQAGENLQQLLVRYPDYQPIQVRLSLAKNLSRRNQYDSAKSLLDATIQSLKEPDAKFWLPILTKVKHNVLIAQAQGGKS